jgi:hypothetical protein
MSDELAMPAPQFAAWIRRHGLRAPYPVDLSGVDAAGVAPVAGPEHAQLQLVRRVLGHERVSVFMLRADPVRVTDCAVAVAGSHDSGRDAVRIRQAGDQVRLARAGGSELVAAIAATLPALEPMSIRTTELAEPTWHQVLALLARHAQPDSARPLEPHQLAGLGLPRQLATAMAAGVVEPVPVGTAAAMTWTDGAGELGPTVASWHEYRGGAVLTRVLAPRRPGGRTQILIGPYHPSELARTLTEAVSTALYRAQPH